jgi:hypothetical protein
MKVNEFSTIVGVVVALHVAALGFLFGPLHWRYLLVAVVSAALIWGVLPTRLSPRSWIGLIIRVAVALTVQQVAFRFLWRSQLGGTWPPLAQFAALHFFIGFGLDRLRWPCR